MRGSLDIRVTRPPDPGKLRREALEEYGSLLRR
jgi:hypothetical protein